MSQNPRGEMALNYIEHRKAMTPKGKKKPEPKKSLVWSYAGPERITADGFTVARVATGKSPPTFRLYCHNDTDPLTGEKLFEDYIDMKAAQVAAERKAGGP